VRGRRQPPAPKQKDPLDVFLCVYAGFLLFGVHASFFFIHLFLHLQPESARRCGALLRPPPRPHGDSFSRLACLSLYVFSADTWTSGK
jgi:hypothetical protein